MKYVVELQEGCWLLPGGGDPGRTLVFESAKRYNTEKGAKIALGIARRYRPFLNAKIRKEPDWEIMKKVMGIISNLKEEKL